MKRNLVLLVGIFVVSIVGMSVAGYLTVVHVHKQVDYVLDRGHPQLRAALQLQVAARAQQTAVLSYLVDQGPDAPRLFDAATADFARWRAELDELGVTLTDTPEGPVWQLR